MKKMTHQACCTSRTESVFKLLCRPTLSNVVGFILLAFLTMALFAPMSALAQNATPAPGQFTFAPDSYFINVILQGILGTAINPGGNATTAGDTISATGTNTLGEVFRTFNIGVAFFGSLMIVFTTIVGVLQSGNDGEFLGRKWSSMWVPIRFATGSALMLPLTSSGYSYCQAVVLWIAGQGVGFADTLWNTIVSKLIVKDGISMTVGVDMNTVMKTMVMAELCTAILNKKNEDARALGGPALPDIVRTEKILLTPTSANPRKPVPADTKTLMLSWQRPGLDVSSGQVATCGSVTYSIRIGQNRGTDPFMNVREAMFKYHQDNLPVKANIYKAAAKTIADKYTAVAATGPADTAVEPRGDLIALEALARDDADGYTSGMSTVVTAALVASGYKTTLNPDGTASDTGTTLSKQGFAMAGMWYLELLKAHSTARHSLEPPLSGLPNLDSLKNDPGYNTFVSVYSDAGNAITSTPVANSGFANGSATQAAIDKQAKIKTTVSSFNVDSSNVVSGGGPSKFFSSLMDWLRVVLFGVGQSSNEAGTNSSTNFAGSASRDPNVSVILQLKDKGETILNVTGVIMTLDVAAKIVVGTAEAASSDYLMKAASSVVSFFGGFVPKAAAYALDKMSGYLVGAAVSLFLFGVMLSVYVPMLPYILWVGALLGLVILILESLVAIMLWAVMMMHPSGEGITSSYNLQGLNMLLALFTRPALLLMGMVLGMFMVEPMVMFVNDTFYTIMQSLQANSLTGLFQGIAFIAIYVSLIMMIVEKSFSMIHVVPDRVLTWIGGPGSLTGEEREITGRTQGMITGAGGAASTIMLGKGIGGRTNTLGKPGSPKKLNAKQKSE